MALVRNASLHPQIRKLTRCAGVSVITTVLSLSVLGTLIATRAIAAGWANIVATIAGIGPSYWLNRRWVWQRAGAHNLAREVLPFWAMSVTALVLSTVAVSVAAHWADQAQLAASLRTGVVLVSNIAVFGSLWIAEFVFLDRVLFRPRAPVPQKSTEDPARERAGAGGLARVATGDGA